MTVKTTFHRVQARWTSEKTGKPRVKVLGIYDTKEAAIAKMTDAIKRCADDPKGPSVTFSAVTTTAEFYIIRDGQVIDSPLTHGEVIRAVRADDNIGLCVYCGDEHSNCEPDMRREKCSACGEFGVYGAEEIFMRIGYPECPGRMA